MNFTNHKKQSTQSFVSHILYINSSTEVWRPTAKTNTN